MRLKVLVACEESQVVTMAFRERGIEAYSCDILPTSGPRLDIHYQCDVDEALNDGPWAAVIAFPPYTDIANSGAKWFAQKRADGRMQRGIDFFMKFAHLTNRYVAIENPVGIMSTVWRKPDQIVQPYMFGDEARKTTCLWLRGLPLLIPTKVVGQGKIQVCKSGKQLPEWYSNAPHKDRARIRSRTFQGLADAMAEQWAPVIREQL